MSVASLRFKSTMAQSDLFEEDPSLYHQHNIYEKSRQGRELAQQISEIKGAESTTGKFERDQRYEIFINKIYELHNHEKRFTDKKKKAFKQMRMAHLNVQSPIQHVLSQYNKLTVRGFDGSVLAESLRLLKLALQARGNKPRVYRDYTITEMD